MSTVVLDSKVTANILKKQLISVLGDNLQVFVILKSNVIFKALKEGRGWGFRLVVEHLI